MLLQAFYSVHSERQLMERIEFDLLFRWFVGIGIDDPVWDHSSFSTNHDRLLQGEIAAKFLAAVLSQPSVKRLLSSQHFSVDGTLVEAWASIKSFKPKPAKPEPNRVGCAGHRQARVAGHDATFDGSVSRSAGGCPVVLRPDRDHGDLAWSVLCRGDDKAASVVGGCGSSIICIS
jgi:hypothetical protein